MLLVELKNVRLGDLGIMNASDIYVQLSYLTRAGWISKRGLFSNKHCCSMALWAR